MCDERSKYREHLDTLTEPHRKKIRKDAKRSALGCLIFGVSVVSISSGMPAHRFAQWIGIPLTISFAVSFAVLLFTCGSILFDWLSERKKV
jgi:hypothetical protein